MTDYAMIRYETNTIRRIVKDIKPHQNAYIVIYPDLNDINLTHITSLNPINLWKVDNENKTVIATYSTISKDFNKEKNIVLNNIRKIRKEKLNNEILIINYNNININIKPNRQTREDINDIINQFKEKIRSYVYWEYEPHQWIKLDINLAKLIWKSIINYRELIFSKQFELENKINNLVDNDFQNLNNISKQLIIDNE